MLKLMQHAMLTIQHKRLQLNVRKCLQLNFKRNISASGKACESQAVWQRHPNFSSNAGYLFANMPNQWPVAANRNIYMQLAEEYIFIIITFTLVSSVLSHRWIILSSLDRVRALLIGNWESGLMLAPNIKMCCLIMCELWVRWSLTCGIPICIALSVELRHRQPVDVDTTAIQHMAYVHSRTEPIHPINIFRVKWTRRRYKSNGLLEHPYFLFSMWLK